MKARGPNASMLRGGERGTGGGRAGEIESNLKERNFDTAVSQLWTLPLSLQKVPDPVS